VQGHRTRKDTDAEEEAACHTGHRETIPVHDAILTSEILSWNPLYQAGAADAVDFVAERHETARNVVCDAENDFSTLNVTLTLVVLHTHELAADCETEVVVFSLAV